MEGYRLQTEGEGKPVERPGRSTTVADVVRFLVGGVLILLGLGLFLGCLLNLISEGPGWWSVADPFIEFVLGLVAVVVGFSTIAGMTQAPERGPRRPAV